VNTPLRERPDAPLGTLIFRAGLLPAETIESALEEGVKTGKRLGEILTERGLISEVDLARLLAGQKGLEFVILRDQIVEPSAAALFTEEQARLFRALPYAFDGELPVVAIADPTDDVLIRNIREALGREDARFVVTARTELAEISADVYSRPLETAPGPAPEPQPEPAPEAVVDTAHANGHAPEDAELVLETPAALEPPAFQVPVEEPVAPESAAAPEPPQFPEPEPAGVSETPSPPEHLLAPEPAPADTAPAAEAVSERPAAPELPAFEQPASEVEQAPAAAGAPEPLTEPSAAPEPPPLAEAPTQPAPAPAEESPVPELLAAEPVPFPQPKPAPPPAPFPPAAAQPEAEHEPAPERAIAPVAGPETVGVPWRMTIRLTNGERVDAGEFPDEATAKQEAKAIMIQVATADQDDWPYVSGRFLKPDTIVSVDIAEHDGDDD
jgi:hypothetical protein